MLPETQYKVYAALWAQADTEDRQDSTINSQTSHVLPAVTAVKFLDASRLHRDTLRGVWELCDEQQGGYLTEDQFYKACKCISICQQTGATDVATMFLGIPSPLPVFYQDNGGPVPVTPQRLPPPSFGGPAPPAFAQTPPSALPAAWQDTPSPAPVPATQQPQQMDGGIAPPEGMYGAVQDFAGDRPASRITHAVITSDGDGNADDEATQASLSQWMQGTPELQAHAPPTFEQLAGDGVQPPAYPASAEGDSDVEELDPAFFGTRGDADRFATDADAFLFGGGGGSMGLPDVPDMEPVNKCGRCTFENTPGATKCEMCEGDLEGGGGGAGIGAGQGTEEDEARYAEVDAVPCGRCGGAVGAEDRFCNACGEPTSGATATAQGHATGATHGAPPVPVQSTAKEAWTCDSCTFLNNAMATFCAVCDSPKGGGDAAATTSAPNDVPFAGLSIGANAGVQPQPPAHPAAAGTGGWQANPPGQPQYPISTAPVIPRGFRAVDQRGSYQPQPGANLPQAMPYQPQHERQRQYDPHHQPAPPPTVWNCSVCTLENDDSLSKCGACESPR